MHLFNLTRQRDQKVSFSPSCMSRGLPEPMIALPAATSGVAHPQPNVEETEGSLPDEKLYGLARIG